MASTPVQSSKWMQQFGNTSCTASTNSSTKAKSSSVGGARLAQAKVERIMEIGVIVRAGIEVHR